MRASTPGPWIALLVLCAACANHATRPGGVSSATHSHRAPLMHGSEREPPAELDYGFELDAELQSLEVRVCPRGRLPEKLIPGVRGGGELLRSMEIERGSERIALERGDTARGVALADLRAGDCVRYTLDLSARPSFGPPEVRRAGRSVMLNTALVLWRPVDYRAYERVHARFVAPREVAISVPWPSDPTQPGRYVLDPSAFAFHAYAAFGALSESRVEAPGGVLDVAVLEGLSSAERAEIDTWVRVQAGAVAAMAGRLPRPHVQVVVLPSGPANEPVRFGSMTRGGGASVGILLGQGEEGAPIDGEALRSDWVLVHELSHLFHPFVAREGAWLSEGIATYYQEVLRVRAGLHAPHDAWRRLLEGSHKGKALDVSVREGAASMYETYIFAPVYWAGAAYALLCDVELRKQSGGQRGLDDVMAELMRDASSADRPWTAKETIARLDALAGAPIFSELQARLIDAPPFPDLTALYVELGIGSDGRTLGAAPLAAIRDAIMRPAR